MESVSAQAVGAATDAGAEFIALVFTLPNMMIMGATWALIESLSKFFPGVFAGKRGRQLKEGCPVLLASALVWIPGALPELASPAERVFIGAILGMATEWLHQKVKRVLMGGRRAEDPAP